MKTTFVSLFTFAFSLFAAVAAVPASMSSPSILSTSDVFSSFTVPTGTATDSAVPTDTATDTAVPTGTDLPGEFTTITATILEVTTIVLPVTPTVETTTFSIPATVTSVDFSSTDSAEPTVTSALSSASF